MKKCRICLEDLTEDEIFYYEHSCNICNGLTHCYTINQIVDVRKSMIAHKVYTLESLVLKLI